MTNFNWRLIDAANVSVDGAVLSRPDYADNTWYKATVPGTILSTLVDNGVYPDPLFGENMRDIPESLNKTAYWYRSLIDVPSASKDKRIWLNFEGINYMADVWVGGKIVGYIRGAFTRGKFDITEFVKPGEANAVAVKILPLMHPGVPHEHLWATGTGPNGGETAADGPTFCCTVGWDWLAAVRDRAMGIWQDVNLETTGPVIIENPYVLADVAIPSRDKADLTLELTLRNSTKEAQTVKLTASYDGSSEFVRSFELAESESKQIVLSAHDVKELQVANPRLWWPNGYGDPNLYTMKLSVATDAGVSHSDDVVFGIRTVGFERPGSDTLTIVVNGVPIISKGGNWAYDDALKRLPVERLDAQVHLHKLANVTMIRNWVGQSTAKHLYEMCDKHGIMLWDEFFQPNPSDGPDPIDAPLYLDNVRDKVLRFRHHACVVLWCGRNEGDPPPHIDKGNADIISEVDPTRFYQSSSTSGHGVLSHGPYRWRTPQEYYVIPHGEKEAFKTEIGSVSIPTLEAVRSMLLEKDWSGPNDAWAQHDLCHGAQRGDQFLHDMTKRYGKPASMEDFVRKSQLMNYEAYRAMYEGRLVQLFNPVTGILTWMSHPAQPSMVWQYYSYDLEAHSSLYGTRKACEPIHVMLNETNDHLVIVNNLPQTLTNWSLKSEVYSLTGELLLETSKTITANELAASDLGGLSLPASLTDVYFVKLKLSDLSGKLVSENFYWREKETASGNLTSINSLPIVALDFKSSISGGAEGWTKITVDVTNSSKSPVLMAHLQLRQAKTGERVLPVYLDENYLNLLPGETKTVTAEFETKLLNGEMASFALDGWNVTTGQVSGDIAIGDNPHAAESHAWGELPPVGVYRW